MLCPILCSWHLIETVCELKNPMVLWLELIDVCCNRKQISEIEFKTHRWLQLMVNYTQFLNGDESWRSDCDRLSGPLVEGEQLSLMDVRLYVIPNVSVLAFEWAWQIAAHKEQVSQLNSVPAPSHCHTRRAVGNWSRCCVGPGWVWSGRLHKKVSLSSD